MDDNVVVSVVLFLWNKKRAVWFCCNWLVALSAIFIFAGFASATAIMDIVWEEYSLNASAIWGPNSDYLPIGHLIGSTDSDSKKGSLISDVSVSIQAASNNAWVHADAEAHMGAETFEVITQVDLYDDISGAPSNFDHGAAHSEWSVLFDILKDDATLDVGGWMLDSSPNYTNRVYLSDLTDMTSTLYTKLTSGISLLSGHRYFLTQISAQQYSGLDDTNPTAVLFQNVKIDVPEPATLVLSGVGLFAFMLVYGRKRNR